MTAVALAGVLAASVLGSVHCLAMCGPLTALHGGPRSLRLTFAHALGRLATYVVLGAAAGLLGGALDLAGRVGDVQRIATLVAGGLVLGWGVVLAVRALLTTRRRERTAVADERASPGGAHSAFRSALVRIQRGRPGRRAVLICMLTGLLPCGWLWAFVITAGGTASPVFGALVMLVFWLGTVPAMVGVLALLGPALTRLRARVPLVTALALIVLGLGTLAMRWRDAGTVQVEAPHCAHCHGGTS
ncbi:MAG: sulfite exporter TauE/SafE family protein [Kofleriaceae bacterium]|nr:sulfite exporter TauE/SafE family protein [Kofleriaceae bacterium]